MSPQTRLTIATAHRRYPSHPAQYLRVGGVVVYDSQRCPHRVLRPLIYSTDPFRDRTFSPILKFVTVDRMLISFASTIISGHRVILASRCDIRGVQVICAALVQSATNSGVRVGVQLTKLATRSGPEEVVRDTSQSLPSHLCFVLVNGEVGVTGLPVP